METVTLKLPPKLLRDAARVAHGDDVTVGHLVRVLLAREVAHRMDPEEPVRAEGGLVPALQALLAKDMAAAASWDDLATRLAQHGYELRPAGGGLALFKSSCGTRVCKGSELGYAYRSLVTRFRAGMPGHPHGDLGMFPVPLTADEKPLDSTEKGRLQRSLEPVFKSSDGWENLMAELARRKFELRPMGTGLAIYALPQGRHLCNTATLGYRYRALVKRFGAAMPGHPHGADWIVPE